MSLTLTLFLSLSLEQSRQDLRLATQMNFVMKQTNRSCGPSVLRVSILLFIWAAYVTMISSGRQSVLALRVFAM